MMTPNSVAVLVDGWGEPPPMMKADPQPVQQITPRPVSGPAAKPAAAVDDAKILAGMARPRPVKACTAKAALDIVFADQLDGDFTPPRELIEGLLTEGGSSLWYGDSNSGKTFSAVSMGCAVSLGALWLGLRTEEGLVIYIAAESPASACIRLQGYQLFHGLIVPNFAIVKSPIDLFDGDADSDLLIQEIRRIELERGLKVKLIIGDTLARLSAGANENSGQDMGLIVRRIDRIRTETGAHFAMIHHAGKIAANGARGWSGLRAAVDTEVEITDSPTGRCLEVTKQRDLPGKGSRIGFRLHVIELGQTQWGTSATTCIALPADTPAKTTGKRISEIGGAVVEFLKSRDSGCRKKDLVEHFAGRYDKSAVYREVKRLVQMGQILEVAGVVGLCGEVQKGAD